MRISAQIERRRAGGDSLDRLVQRFRGSTGEIALNGAEIRHEQCVTDKSAIPIVYVRQAGVRPGVCGTSQASGDLKTVAMLGKRVELAAVALKPDDFVEHLSERFLDHRDTVADTDTPAQWLLQIGCRRKMPVWTWRSAIYSVLRSCSWIWAVMAQARPEGSRTAPATVFSALP